MSENPTRVRIKQLLEGSPMPDGTTVHYSHVSDQELVGPFCIFHMEPGLGGSEEWSMGGGGLETETWVVKGAGPKLKDCEAIDAAAQLALTDHVHAFCRRLGPIAYSEVNHGKTTWYRGSRYQIRKDKDE